MELKVDSLVLSTLRTIHHPVVKQLVWLLLWACMSLSAMLTNRVLVHYHDFAAPWFLCLLSAGAVSVVARLLVFLLTDDSSSGANNSNSSGTVSNCSSDWLHVCLVGVIMWASVALSIASLRSLPLPVVILIQAAGPAASYWLAVLLQQEDATWWQSLKACLVFCSAAAALLPHHAEISTTGLTLQCSAVFLDILWQRLHLRALNSTPSTPTSTSTDLGRPYSGLALLADASPAAVAVLLPALLKFDMWQWKVQQYSLHSLMPLAAVSCMMVGCLMVLKVQQPILQGLTAEPTGPVGRVFMDGLMGLIAAKLLNEHLSGGQWFAYAVAQLAAVALWASSSSLAGSSSNSRRQGFAKLPAVLG